MAKIIVSMQERLAKINSLAKLNQTGQTISDDASCELGELVADLADAVTELATIVAMMQEG